MTHNYSLRNAKAHTHMPLFVSASRDGTYLDHAIKLGDISSVMLPVVVVNGLLRNVGRQGALLPGQGGQLDSHVAELGVEWSVERGCGRGGVGRKEGIRVRKAIR